MGAHSLVEQPTTRPTRKITAAGLGALLATIVLSLADLADAVDLPTFWDSILTGAAAFASGYTAKASTKDR